MKHSLSIIQKRILSLISNKLAHEGKAPTIRELMSDLGYSSTRSVTLHLDTLIEKGYLSKADNGRIIIKKGFIENDLAEKTVQVPVVGSISCGSLFLAEENIVDHVSLSTKIANPPSKYFILKAFGDSMNLKGINDGDFLLIKQTNDAKEKDIVVALVNDEATIKEFHKEDDFIVLSPRSSNNLHRPIIVTDNIIIQGIFERALPPILQTVINYN